MADAAASDEEGAAPVAGADAIGALGARHQAAGDGFELRGP